MRGMASAISNNSTAEKIPLRGGAELSKAPSLLPQKNRLSPLLRRLLLFRPLGQHRLELVDEVVHVLELAVDAGEADEGDLVELAQVLHHQLANVGGFHLGLKLGVHVAFDCRDDGFEL